MYFSHRMQNFFPVCTALNASIKVNKNSVTFLLFVCHKIKLFIIENIVIITSRMQKKCNLNICKIRVCSRLKRKMVGKDGWKEPLQVLNLRFWISKSSSYLKVITCLIALLGKPTNRTEKLIGKYLTVVRSSFLFACQVTNSALNFSQWSHSWLPVEKLFWSKIA